ncbi:translation machinery-associated protein 16 [Obelidium mucronatum]|nr:translation machinery-associated protein 16 [Obelidium mucronatum]
MPNNKKHKVSKIKGAEKAHPYSRKAGQMRRAFAREERVDKLKTMKDADRMREVDRMVWFKYALPDEVAAATPEMVHDLIDQYIHRNDDEVEALKATIRPNRPKPAKLGLYDMLMGKDRHEYRTGMKVPNMTDAANVVRLRQWEGDYNGIGAIKMVSVVASSKPGGITMETEETIEDEETVEGEKGE